MTFPDTMRVQLKKDDRFDLIHNCLRRRTDNDGFRNAREKVVCEICYFLIVFVLIEMKVHDFRVYMNIMTVKSVWFSKGLPDGEVE